MSIELQNEQGVWYRIGFDSTRDGNTEIYVMDADGSHPTRLTNDPAMGVLRHVDAGYPEADAAAAANHLTIPMHSTAGAGSEA